MVMVFRLCDGHWTWEEYLGSHPMQADTQI